MRVLAGFSDYILPLVLFLILSIALMKKRPVYDEFTEGDERTSRLKEMIEKKNPYCLIEIDGGVNTQNAERLYECGADVLVAGSAVFASENPMETIKQLKLIK